MQPKEFVAVTLKSFRSACVSVLLVLAVSSLTGLPITFGQSFGAGTVEGTVTDPMGAVVPGARVAIENRQTGYKRTTNTHANGNFRFDNIPPNKYSGSASAQGFTADQ